MRLEVLLIKIKQLSLVGTWNFKTFVLILFAPFVTSCDKILIFDSYKNTVVRLQVVH